MKYIKVLVDDDFDPEKDDKIIKKSDIWEPQYVQVLDKGFLGLIDFMGDDMAVVNAARVSYGKGTKKVSEDRHLIRYLMRMHHSTPFEMIETKWHIKMPIFVARQWVRHRTASINEYSGRFSVMTDDMYMPNLEDILPQSKDNKQGRNGEMSDRNAYACQLQLEHIYKEARQAYQYLLGQTNIPSSSLNERRMKAVEFAIEQIKRLEKTDPKWAPELITEQMIQDKIDEVVLAHGIAFTDDEFVNNDGLTRELARIALPLANYTEMYWKCDLKNTMHFLTLRCDSHAQKEIRVYADQMYEMMKPLFPVCMEAFVDYHLKGTHLSIMETQLLKDMYQTLLEQDFNNEQFLTNRLSQYGASKREVSEFMTKLHSLQEPELNNKT